jgi:4-hydroxy-4-methyl-2-oxoglutarate aldolase
LVTVFWGDMDGIVIIPKALTEEVLLDAEKAVTKERGMHRALRRGMSLKEAYKRYGSF